MPSAASDFRGERCSADFRSSFHPTRRVRWHVQFGVRVIHAGRLQRIAHLARGAYKNAYGLDTNQLFGLPKWAGSEKYEIEARIDGETSYALSKLSGDQLKLAHQRLLQSLLRDRFKLTVHNEPKQMPVYWLVVPKNGPTIRESKPGDQYADGIKSRSGNLIGPHMALVRLGGGRIAAQGLPLENLVSQLTAQLGRKIIDKTGLTGSYDFTLEWMPDAGPANRTDEPGPSIFTALQEQLGLKLEPHVGPVDIFVIDHVETPSEN